MSGSARPTADIIDLPRRAPVTGNTIEIETDPESQSVLGNGDTLITIGIAGDEDDAPPGPDRFDRNLADGMDDMALASIASYLLDGIDADLQSRAEWEETANRAADYLGIKLNDPSAEPTADGTVCKTIATTLLEALIKVWSVARAELLPAGGPVKVAHHDVPTLPVKKDAPQPGGLAPEQPDETGIAAGSNQDDEWGADDALADALQKDLNHYLTVTDREYYPGFSQMLLNRALIGMAFRKVYRCPLRRRPVSVGVKGQDLIVSNDCSHLSGAGRVTERIRMRQATMRRMQVSGAYRDVALVQPTGQVTQTERSIGELEGVNAAPQLPQDFEHLVYECHCELGSGTTSSLIGDLGRLDYDENGRRVGYPLPYRVSIDVDSREILEIRRNWKPGDPDHRVKPRYVKYGFIPGLGFYDFGLIHIVGNPTQAATMLQRAMVDASLFANFPGGVFLQGTNRQSQTVIRPAPGQFVGVSSAGATSIKDALMPMPYRAPGAEEAALLDRFEGQVSRLAGLITLPVGESIGNVPVGTVLAYIDSVSQVPGAIHKDDHISQSEEFELLRALFAEDPEELWRGRRSPARKWQVAREIMSPDLSPAADPNTPSQVHRFLKAQAIVGIGGLPQFQGIADNRAIYRRALMVLGEDDPEELELPAPGPNTAPPPPDPKVVAAQIRAQETAGKNAATLQKAKIEHEGDMAEIAARGDNERMRLQAAEMRASATQDAAREKLQADNAHRTMDRVHDTVNRAADREAAQGQHEDKTTLDAAAQLAPPAPPTDATPTGNV